VPWSLLRNPRQVPAEGSSPPLSVGLLNEVFLRYAPNSFDRWDITLFDDDESIDYDHSVLDR